MQDPLQHNTAFSFTNLTETGLVAFGDAIKTGTLTEEYFEALLYREVEAEKEKIDTAYRDMDVAAFKDYILAEKAAFLKRVETVVGMAKPADFITTAPGLYLAHTLQALENLLNFIEAYLPCTRATPLWLPFNYRILLKGLLTHKLDVIIRRLQRANIDAALIDIVLAPIHRFITPAYPPDTDFRNASYLKTLKDALETRCKSPDLCPQALHRLLLHYNFNSKPYIAYYTDQLSEEIKTGSDAERRHKLSQWRDQVHRHQHHTDIGLSPKEQSLADQLRQWINNEITTLIINCAVPKEVYGPTANDVPRRLPTGNTSTTQTKSPEPALQKRLAIDLSIPIISVLIHILHHLGVINATIADIARCVARGIFTRGSQKPTSKSLQNAFYEAPDSTFDAVRKLCYRIIAYIDERGISKG